MTDHKNNGDDSSSPREVEGENDPPEQSFVEVFQTEYGEDESPYEAVVMAVSAVEGAKPTNMEPLYDRVDPDPLDRLMDGPILIGDGGTIDVEFPYSGYRVSVQNNGVITILEDEDGN